MPLAHQVQKLLGHSALVISTERVDDGALLSGPMVTMGFGEVLDRPLPRPWQQRGIRGGWTAGIWRASLLTEGDHRQGSGEADSKGLQTTLRPRSAQVIAPLDGRADRRGHRLKHLSQPTYWHGSAEDVKAHRLEGEALPHDVLRCEAPTVAGDHDGREGGLWQCGHRQDDPSRPQRKVMPGALDPLGMPGATAVLSGARAEDG